jgi:hypothetical protein
MRFSQWIHNPRSVAALYYRRVLKKAERVYDTISAKEIDKSVEWKPQSLQGDVVLVKYFDLRHVGFLFEKSHLYLSCLHTFDDPQEGLLFREDFETIDAHVAAVSNIATKANPKLTREEAETRALHYFNVLHFSTSRAMFANCWNIADVGSNNSGSGSSGNSGSAGEAGVG